MCIIASFIHPALAQTIVGNQQVIQVPTTDWGAPANALLSLPDDYASTNQTYPLILFLHAWTEAGTDINKLLATALPQRIAQGFKPAAINPVDGRLYKFIVLSPQAPDFSFQYGHIKNILADVLKRYKIDASRIYITGASAGGFGTWTCITDDAEFCKSIAAIAPMSSMAVDSDRPNKIKNAAKYGVAVWDICGTADDKWPIAVDYNNRINSANPVIRAKLTGIPNIGHTAWTYGYDKDWRIDNMNVYEWMLQYSRGSSTPPPPEPAPAPAPAPVPQPQTASTANNQPYIYAGEDVFLNLPSNSITLTGTFSDTDGWVQTLSWAKLDGPSEYTITSGNSSRPEITNLVAGMYTFRFTGTDNAGNSAYDDISITVTQNNTAQASRTEVKYIGVNVYSGENPCNIQGWNNWNVGKGYKANIQSGAWPYSDGSSSSISTNLSMSSAVADNSAGYAGPMAPSEVLRYTSFSNETRVLTISGLSTSKKFNIELYASRNNSLGSTTRFTVNASSVTINSYFNAEKKAVFNNLTPNANGQLLVEIKNMNPQGYNYLNGFVLTEMNAGQVSTVNTLNASAAENTAINDSWKIYPNPVNDRLGIEMTNSYTGEIKAQIIDHTGRLRQEFKINKNQPFININVLTNNLSAGTYMLHFQFGNRRETRKFLKL
jgi:hypothetical protein